MQEDIIVAQSLLREYIDKFNAIQDEEVTKLGAIMTLTFQTYNKYFQLNDVTKQVFRDLVLARGTKECIIEADENDLTKEQEPMGAANFFYLFATIEVRDKHQGSFGLHTWSEYMKQFHATMCCPRETVHYFHRRNSCNCLHEIYYNLKDATQRTTGCWYCFKTVDIKKVFHCKCDMKKYCTKKCALDDWPRHKDECIRMRVQLK
jgi:hypothetical protein